VNGQHSTKLINWMLVLLLPGSEGEVWNVGSGNRGGFDEVKVCSQRILYGIIVDS